MRILLAAICLCIGLGGPVTAVIAQEKQPLITIRNQLDAARKQMKTERKLVLAGELDLTPDESKAFWPVWNEYQDEMDVLGAEHVRIITDYAENFDNLSEEFAEQLLRDYLEMESKAAATRKKYLRRFKKALPTIKVVRLYQVEGKLDAVIDFQLASQIPLAEATAR